MIIREKFKSLIPPLTTEEFEQLEQNCLKDGIRDPLVVWDDGKGDCVLIDGHNRYRIAQKHGLSYNTAKMNFRNENEVMAWVIKNQIGRRNLDTWVKFDMAKTLEEIAKADAKARQGTRSDIKPTLAESERGQSRDHVARIVGVSHGTYDKMKTIDREGDAKLNEAVRSGRITTNQAYNAIQERKKPKPKPPMQAARDRIEEIQSKEVPSIQDLRQLREDKETISEYEGSSLGDAVKSMMMKISRTAIHVRRWSDEQVKTCMASKSNESIIYDLNRAIEALEEIKLILTRGGTH